MILLKKSIRFRDTFECVEVFQSEQVSTEVLIQQLAAGTRPPRRKKERHKERSTH